MKICTILFLYLMGTLFASGQQANEVDMVDCFLDDCSGMRQFPALQFGYMTVPENYDQPDGNQIRIAFAILRSQDKNPKPDPIIWFEGGWGMPTLKNIFRLAKGFPVKNRDIIFYDYRGSGYSEPALCPELGQSNWELIKKDLNYRQFNDSINALAYACLQQIHEKGIDYRQYGTEIKTRDAVVLIQKLGYKEVNLFGISNGTMGIQGFIRSAENSGIKIRSVLSDSNMPMTHFKHGNSIIHYKNVLDSLLTDCAGNPDCADAYPDLKKRFYAFLNELELKPMSANGKHQLVFNRYEVNALIHQLMYSHKNFRDLPILLEQLMAGNLKFFDSVYDYFRNFIGSMNGTAIVNYVYDWKACQEEAIAIARVNNAAFPDFELMSDFYLDFFVNDRTIDFNARDTVPVRSDIPSLVLAGSYDPATPPEYSNVMHRRYTNSFYFVLPKIGHGAVMTDCGSKLYLDFIENPDEKPVTDCVDALKREEIPFTTSYYPNQHISTLILGIVQQKNIGLIAVIIVPFLFSLIVFIRQVILRIKRKRIESIQLGLSLAIVLFLGGLIFYSIQTASRGGMLILFGLVGEASWLPWLALLLIVLFLISISEFIRRRYISFWNIGMLICSALTSWLILTYQVVLW